VSGPLWYRTASGAVREWTGTEWVTVPSVTARRSAARSLALALGVALGGVTVAVLSMTVSLLGLWAVAAFLSELR